MSVRLVSAEEAGCPIFRDLKKQHSDYKPYNDHISRSHFLLSSLPSPAEMYEIPSYPIELSNEELNFDPKNVANLWFKLLAMQTMNGNFVKHGNISQQQQKTFSLPTADPEKLRKELLFIRYKLQKMLPNFESTIDAGLVPELSRYIGMLENCCLYFNSQALQSTSIDGVLKDIVLIKDIPLEEEFGIRNRCQDLYNNMEKVLAGTPVTTSSDSASQLERKPKWLEEELEMPMCCLTQLSPEECIKIQEAAKLCHPPVDKAVVELMCTLPYFSDKNGGCRDHQISSSAQLVSPPEILEKGEKAGQLERLLFYGPTLPSEMLQLTDFCGAWCGFALFLDTKTGESVDFKDCGGFESGPCEKFEGPRKPIEELLQGWVDEWLTMYMVPYGESPACELWRNMAYLNQKRLLQEYNWPHSFPLPERQYRTLVKFQDQLINKPDKKFAKETSEKTYMKMRDRWDDLSEPLRLRNAGEAEKENWKINQILEFFKKHVAQQQELEYVLATGELMQEKYRDKISLTCGEASGYQDGKLVWSAKITPEEMLGTFGHLAGPPDAWDDVVMDMFSALWEASEEGKKPAWLRGSPVELPDDDETEDYDEMLEEYEVVGMDLDGDESMEDSSSDDESESDEGDLEDLEVEALRADAEMELDVVGDAKGFVENIELPIR